MSAATWDSASAGARFAPAKFRPPALPTTLVMRPALRDRLRAGASQRLTVVVGSVGTGKSVLLSSWAAARPAGSTSWLSCDKADADPPRFWAAFIEASRAVEPGFGADAAGLLAGEGAGSADVISSIANDAAKLPAGSAIVVDDFHYAAPAVAGTMSDLVEWWPADTAQLVLSSHFDPPLRLHRLRMAGELCELRDRDLNFSLAEAGDLLAKFGVQVTARELSLLHQRSEGWAAAVQMAALSLRGTADPARIARALEADRHAIAGYFITEVLDRQPPEIAQFLLDTSVLGELTAGSCTAVTGRHDAAALLRGIHAANLFIVALDDDQTSFRYHRLVRQVLRAELRARNRAREQALHLRAAGWLESAGDTRRAARHLAAARQADQALTLLQDRAVADFLENPALPEPLDPGTVKPALCAGDPGRLLALAADLLLSGDPVRGGEYLELLERAQQPIPPGSGLAARLAATRALRHMLAGQAEPAVSEALVARGILQRAQVSDQWAASLPMVLLRAHTWLEDFQAVDREAAAVLATPGLPEPVKRVMVPGAQALAWLESGRLAQAADAAATADAEARRLGFGRHFFAVDHLRAVCGLALERQDLDTAGQLSWQALSISRQRRPASEFLTLLDRARIQAARGQPREALATAGMARRVLAGTGSVLLAQADELEALIRLSLGDLRSPAGLAVGLPVARRSLLLAKVALACGDHRAAGEHLQALPPGETTPRRALERQLLLAAAAIERGDPAAAGIVGGALGVARRGGFLRTVVTTAPQVTSYLVEHPALMRGEPFTGRLITAALEARAAQPATSQPRRPSAEPLTAAEQRILKLLPTSTYPQMAAALHVSRNTVKTHVRSVYQKLGAASRSQALRRAVELHLL